MLYLISLETFFQKHISRKPRRTTTRTRHPVHMSSHAARTAVTDTSGGIASGNTPASLADPQAAIPDLPDHVVVNHILRSEYFDDPADLARLRVVSQSMRDAVTATGLKVEEVVNGSTAVELGCLSALRRLQRRGRLSTEERKYFCEAAARGGHLEELKVLRANGCPWDEQTCSHAAAGGNLVVLQWARANGCPWDEETCSLAAGGGIFSRLHCVNRSGRFEVLQWLHANGCPWNADTCEEAARHGDLEMLQWPRANGCPWDRFTCQFAAQCGHLEVLKWARANGCPWNVNTCYMVAGPDNLELKKWLRANGYPETYSDDSVDEEEDDFSEDYESDDESE